MKLRKIGFDPKPFEKMWPFASGIVGSTETIHFVPPWPRQIRFVKSDDQIFVRAEGHTVQFETELKVNISEPGDCAKLGDLSPAILQTKNRFAATFCTSRRRHNLVQEGRSELQDRSPLTARFLESLSVTMNCWRAAIGSGDAAPARQIIDAN